MPTKALNNKSQKMKARLPQPILDELMQVKRADENLSQFISTAIVNEIAHRQKSQSQN